VFHAMTSVHKYNIATMERLLSRQVYPTCPLMQKDEEGEKIAIITLSISVPGL